MLDLLIKFVMNIIITISQAIFTPFLVIITGLFPSIESYVVHILAFFREALTYVPSVLRLLCFDSNMMSVIFDYFLIKYTIHVAIITVKFAINLYNKFKP